ncbi:MAG: DUF1822 family protein [Leptolyngbya sp. SIOISBB]|nr:DUF1822 family protein [Leptolyngbya sp. SIOISBB]
MSDLSNLSAFTLPLALTAHRRAQTFQRRHSTPALQKRVYLNTLAAYAGATFLEMRGYDVDLDHSYSHDPTQQTLLDVADVKVIGVGRLECRPVLPEASELTVPAEVTSDRVAYIAIRLDESLRQAQLLGFIDVASVSTRETLSIPLADLRSPEELGIFLEQVAQRAAQSTADTLPVHLSRWLQQTVETGWQALSETVAELATPAPNLVFRSSPTAAEDMETQLVPTIGQSKPVTLGTEPDAVTVRLLVGLIPQSGDELEVWVQINPATGQTRLPTNLRLSILDESDIAVIQAEARDTEAIQLKFVAVIAEQFSIQIALDDHTFTERFEV